MKTWAFWSGGYCWARMTGRWKMCVFCCKVMTWMLKKISHLAFDLGVTTLMFVVAQLILFWFDVQVGFHQRFFSGLIFEVYIQLLPGSAQHILDYTLLSPFPSIKLLRFNVSANGAGKSCTFLDGGERMGAERGWGDLESWTIIGSDLELPQISNKHLSFGMVKHIPLKLWSPNFLVTSGSVGFSFCARRVSLLPSRFHVMRILLTHPKKQYEKTDTFFVGNFKSLQIFRI